MSNEDSNEQPIVEPNGCTWMNDTLNNLRRDGR